MGTSTETATKADLYRRAAQGMERHDNLDTDGWDWAYSCCAIGEVGGTEADMARYVTAFAPEGPHTADTNLQYAFGDGESQEARAVRILALCFMAAMVEAGDA